MTIKIQVDAILVSPQEAVKMIYEILNQQCSAISIADVVDHDIVVELVDEQIMAVYQAQD